MSFSRVSRVSLYELLDSFNYLDKDEIPGMYSTVVAVSLEDEYAAPSTALSVISDDGEKRCRDGEFMIFVLGGSAGGACKAFLGGIGVSCSCLMLKDSFFTS